MIEQKDQTEAACGGSALTEELDVLDAEIRKFAKSIGRDLRTSEYVIFKHAWDAALSLAVMKIEGLWGHITSDSDICRELMRDKEKAVKPQRNRVQLIVGDMAYDD